MQLFLSGGGNGKDSVQLDKKFIEALDKNKPVLYIPIAINANKHPYLGCLDWLKNNFKSLGFNNFTMWVEKDLIKKKAEDFEKFGGIYIGGGNTFKLLKELKDFGTFEILKKLAISNIPIYGGSAGAIIFAKTIISVLPVDKNNVGLKNFSGMNFVGDCDIWCHYKETDDRLIIEHMKKHNLSKIISIPDNAGLYVKNQEIEIVGPSNVAIFNLDKKEILKAGSTIYID